eukprot:XP_001703506.1 predicted protein [Chlamydomonas reinhardtii]
MCPLLVKICAFSRDGAPAGEFSGFQYSTSSNTIVGAAHMVGFSGLPRGSGPLAEMFKARYADGFEEVVEVRNSAADQLPDIAILKGIVSNSKIGSITITAHADNGYSGGPVVNTRGQLVGTIKGGTLHTTMQQVNVTSAEQVHVFLLQSKQPGLG